MKKILLTSLLTLSIHCYAGFNGLTSHSRANCINNESITWDATHYWNIPSRITPAQPPSIDKQYSSFDAYVAERKAQIKQNGYYKTNSLGAKFLLNLPVYSRDEIKQFSLSNNKEDTHLKQVPSQIKLAFPFTPKINKTIIGYAPIGSYHNGWTGIKVFFLDDNLVCSYSYFDLTASNGKVESISKDAMKLINNKPTTLSTEGSDESGFLYSITWYTPTTMSMMECANKNYNPAYETRTLQLAKQMD